MKKRITNILLVVFSFLFVQEIYYEIKNFKSAYELYNEIEVMNPLNSVNLKSNENKSKADILYNNLKEINEDYKFWINIENTDVNYPVVQTIDNDFYLKNNFRKTKHKYGAIFIDAHSNFYEDFNTIIYGHNMRNRKMFTDITKYKNIDFFNQNNKIYIIDKNFKYVFEVVSVYTIRGVDDPNYLYNINKPYCQKLGLIDLENRSLFNFKKFNDTKKIITLITCSYEEKDTRTVIHAKLNNKFDLN